MPGMKPLDKSIANSKALVIDSNPTSRGMLVAMMRDFGFGSVAQASRVEDARRMLENHVYDLVLCDYHFDGQSYSGQDLLDDLRRAQLLPLSTVFIMVTGEASYAKVAEAAESALDGYLLKPHSAATLAERITQARHRKRVLQDVLTAMEESDFETAARLCLARFHARGQYWLYAARLGAELLLRLGRHDDARGLLEAVIEAQALPWARLGIARAQLESKQLPQARRTLESLMAEQPAYVDAFDVMGRVQVEQGELTQALETYRKAAQLTPSSISRLQKQGMLAFYSGERDEATQALERATGLGIGSKMFDFQSLLMLALLRFDARDSKGLQRCIDNLQHALEKVPNSTRLQRFVRIALVFKLMLEKQVARVISEVKLLAQEAQRDDFDFEAACNLLAVIARLSAAELQLPDAELWLRDVSQRFSVSKASSELLAQAALCHEPSAEAVRAGHHAVTQQAEQAMTHNLAGNHQSAVKALLNFGAQTRNLKLIEMAGLALQRYRDKVPEADALQAQIDDLKRRYGALGHQTQLGKASVRPEGGMVLKGEVATVDDADAAPPTGP